VEGHVLSRMAYVYGMQDALDYTHTMYYIFSTAIMIAWTRPY
jgi:hypothetical protein